jgi:hypothetical protein
MTEEQIEHMVVRDKRRSWVILISLAFNLCTLVVAIAWSAREQRATEHKFCAIVTTQQGTTPPTSDYGRQLAANLAALARDLRCTPEPARPRVTPSPYGYPPSTTGRR